MATAAELQAQIEAIDAKLAGPSSANLNGRSLAYDMKALSEQRNRLVRQLAAKSRSRFSRVVFKNAT